MIDETCRQVSNKIVKYFREDERELQIKCKRIRKR